MFEVFEVFEVFKVRGGKKGGLKPLSSKFWTKSISVFEPNHFIIELEVTMELLGIAYS